MAQKVEGRLRVGQTCELRKEGRTFSTCSFMVEAPAEGRRADGCSTHRELPEELSLT